LYGGSALPSELGMFITAALAVAVIGVLLAGRLEADPDRARPIARYLGTICVFTLFVTLFAAFGVVHSLTDLVVNHEDRFDYYAAYYEGDVVAIEGEGTYLPIGYTVFDFSTETKNDGNYTAAFASGLVALTTGFVFMLHARWRRRLMSGPRGSSEAALRVDRAYHLGVCGVSALVAALSVTSAGFGAFEIIAPGVALGEGADITQAEGVSELLSWGVLGLASVLIFLRNWHRVSEDLGISEPAATGA
jgi:hypothetical protein